MRSWSYLSRRTARLWRWTASLAAGAVVAGMLSLGAAAVASAAPTTPPATVSCSGTINPDQNGPAAGNAHPFDYSFSCTPTTPDATDPTGYSWNYTGNIWSYTITVTRQNDDGNNLTFNAPTATVYSSPGVVDATQYVNCASSIPSDGFNCSAPGPGATSSSDFTNGSNPPYLSYIPAGESVSGGFAMTNQYCPFLPRGAAPGTPAVPQAVVELTVTDTNGVSDGPFELTRSTPCKTVPAVVPEPKKKKKAKAKKHTERKSHRTRHARG